jgi:hypothetical protein
VGAATLETEAEQEEAGVQCGAREHKPWRARKQVHQIQERRQFSVLPNLPQAVSDRQQPHPDLRGLAHGLAQGLVHVLVQGLAQGLVQGLAQGLAHGLAQPHELVQPHDTLRLHRRHPSS